MISTKPTSFQTTATNGNFGLPLTLSPSTSYHFSQLHIGQSTTDMSNHLNLFSPILSSISFTPTIAQMFSFLIPYRKVLPLIHLNILISVTLILLACCFLEAQHSLPYNITGLIVVRENFPPTLWVSCSRQFCGYLAIANFVGILQS